MVSRRVPTLIKSITLVVPLLTLGATVRAPANSLHADDCLAAPNSPAPEGSWWYYRLDWPTQRKCWYLRAPDRSLRRGTATAAAPLRSTPIPFGRRHSAADGPPISVDPGDAASPPPRVELPVKSPTPEAITGTVGKLVQQSVQQDGSTPPPTETPASQASNEAAGPPVTATARPDPVLAGPAGQAQDSVAILSNTPADSASNDAERYAGSHELTNNAGMVTIFAVLALGLVAVGMPIIAKNVTTRRARTIIDHREPDRTNDQSHQDRRGPIDERQLLVSVLSDRGPVRNDDVPLETAFEIRKRKDKLARLHQNLDRLLQAPTTAWEQPLTVQRTSDL